eukprot:CAMPEP_0197528624 /NCGR_PEP_ID=MMETSP1318-20131121/25829_1 /TAXON_ID=552666 /ORGANISM="Partenskyella glossopodia, Strain RCC365" /LENGTH=242 /DNA_ID=CAMNT_0043083801 /DNA_START=27 /DNA_END=755 /DNA_ORIENTATION=+
MVGTHGGYDGIFIDQEHASSNLPRDIEVASLAAKHHGLDSFVRRPANDYCGAMAPLEAGAGGVLFSMIEDAKHAEKAMQWTKFAPRGARGLFGANRDGAFGLNPPSNYVKEANESTLIGMQIETPKALAEVDEIVAIEDLDFVFAGPFDLSQVMGVTGEINHDLCWEAIGKIAKACEKAGLAWGTVPRDDEYAERALSMGCQVFLAGHDFAAILAGLQATKGKYPCLFDSAEPKYGNTNTSY